MPATASAARNRDVRTIECHAKPDAILAAFDALAPHDALIVVSQHAPQKLLSRLQAERAGLFEWSPLESGPGTWRTELFRRDVAPGSLRAVNEALSWDHDRLEDIERRVFEARSAGDHASAAQRFREFDFGLRRHIRFEEQILFPAFEERTGLPAHAGPTGVMRSEHREIEALLEGLRAVIELPGPAADVLRADLMRVLGWHNEKEENVLYPGIDRLLTEQENDALVARIQAS